ncbi:iron-sulfur cluster-binding protein, partial [Metarhizium majus ARSEF 297]
MILGKDMIVRSFHNVCRHRAFPVARKQSGSALVLGCRYHGWSYDTSGTLVKAPYFDNIPGFDKSQNSLFEIHTKEDRYGFLHINVSSREEVAATTPSEGMRNGELGQIKLDSHLLDTMEFKGRFNWKVILNNQPKESSTEASTKGIMGTFISQSPHYVGKIGFFPLTTAHTMSNRPFWYQLTYSPETSQRTAMRCDVYSSTVSKGYEIEDATKISLENELQQKIKEFEKQQKHLTTSDNHSTGANDSHVNILRMLEGHLRQEKIRGTEIKPATVKQQFQSEAFTKADKSEFSLVGL